jgi:hypothetical protein
MYSARKGDDGANATDGSFRAKPVFGHCLKCGGTPADGAKLSVCSGCMSVPYCSERCQRADWKEHKLLCAARRDVR